MSGPRNLNNLCKKNNTYRNHGYRFHCTPNQQTVHPLPILHSLACVANDLCISNTLLPYLLLYLLTACSRVLLVMMTDPQLAKKFPTFYGTTKVHYRIHKCPPSVPILSHIDPVLTPTSYFLRTYLNIILPSTPGSFKWSFSFRFPHRNPVHASPLPHTCYMARSSHRIFFSLNNSIISRSLTDRPFFGKNSEAYVGGNVTLHKIRFLCLQCLIALKIVQFIVIIFSSVLS